jgi:hypothetical protein
MSKFELPDVKSKSPGTAALANYKSQLNKLAKNGFTTTADLILKDTAVVKFINDTLYNSEDIAKNLQHKNSMYYAIMYALADTEYIKKPNAYYWAIQQLKDKTNWTKATKKTYEQVRTDVAFYKQGRAAGTLEPGAIPTANAKTRTGIFDE